MDVIRDRLTHVFHSLPQTDRAAWLDWLDQVIGNGDATDRALLELLLNGQISVRMDGREPRFTLTEAGKAKALHLISDKPELRALLEQLSGRAVTGPPKKVQ